MANITIERRVSLDGPVLPESMAAPLYVAENQAHQFVITATSKGEPVTLTGSVQGRLIRPDGNTVLLTGSISDGKAVATLPQSAYAYQGRYTLAIMNVVNTVVTVIYAATGNIANTMNGAAIDPGSVVPDITELLAEIDTMREATAEANAAAANAGTLEGAVGTALKGMTGINPLIPMGIWVEGEYVSTSGNILPQPYGASLKRTDYLPLGEHAGSLIFYTDKGDDIDHRTIYNCFFDANKNYLSNFSTWNGREVAIPDGAAYVMLSIETDYVLTAQKKVDEYWTYDRVSFRGDVLPTFFHRSSVAMIVTFMAGMEMWAIGKDGLSRNLTYTFAEETSFQVQHDRILVWDIEDNTVKLIYFADLSPANRYIVLVNYGSGKFNFGALYPYYIQGMEAMTTYKYPPYYDVDNYFAQKIQTVRNREKAIGTHGDGFVFVTDTHWGWSNKKAPALVRAVLNQTQVDRVLHGGDVCVAYSTEENMYAYLNQEISDWEYAVGDKMYRVIGNHDIHCYDRATDPPTLYILTAEEVFGLMAKKQESRVHYNPNNDQMKGMYFYFDNPAQKIRYIGINPFQQPNTRFISNYQVSWVGDRLLELEADWSVVIYGHCTLIAAQIDSQVAYEAYTDMRQLIAAAANKRIFTTSYGRTFDYTDKDFVVIGYFCGHKHADAINVDDGVTYVVTTCEAPYGDDGYGRQKNTISETAFDVVQIDTINRHVWLTRVGAGYDRDFEY